MNTPLTPDDIAAMRKMYGKCTCPNCRAGRVLLDAYEALTAECERLREAARWIPVTEPPKENQWCHVSDGSGIYSGHYQYHRGKFYNTAFEVKEGITHWRPLPAAPDSVDTNKMEG